MYVWTIDIPSEEGWYWHKPVLQWSGQTARITELQLVRGVVCDKHANPVLNGSWWAGPIQEPVEE